MEFLTQLVESVGPWSYLILFIGLIVEGEGVVLAFAFLTSLGFFNFYLILPFIIVAEWLGDSFWFVLGRAWGMKFIRRYGKYFFLPESRLNKIASHFDQDGGKTVFISKFVYSMNKITMITAGVTKMKFQKFIKYSGLAVVVWSVLFFSLGYLFGQSFELLKQYVANAEKVLLLIIIVFVLIRYLLEKRIKSRVE